MAESTKTVINLVMKMGFKIFSHFRPSQSSFVRTSLMLSGPSLPSLPLPSLLQYLLLVSYRAEDKVTNQHGNNMIAILFQLLVLGNFVSVEELEGAARTLHEEFHRLTETEVTQRLKIISIPKIFPTHKDFAGCSCLFFATASKP